MNVVARPRPTGAGQVPGLCHQVVAGVPLVIHCIPCAASTGQRSRPIDSRRTGVTVVDVASGNHDVAAAQFDDGAVGDGHRNAAVPVVGAWAGSVTAPPPWCPPSPRRLMGSPESALLKAASRPRTDTRSERHCAFAGSRPTSRTPDVQARLHERPSEGPHVRTLRNAGDCSGRDRQEREPQIPGRALPQLPRFRACGSTTEARSVRASLSLLRNRQLRLSARLLPVRRPREEYSGDVP